MLSFRNKEHKFLIAFFKGSALPQISSENVKLELYRNGSFEKFILVPRSQLYKMYSPCKFLSWEESYKFFAEKFILEKGGKKFAIIDGFLSIYNEKKSCWFKVEFALDCSKMSFSKMRFFDE